jgi:hypothetical protein
MLIQLPLGEEERLNFPTFFREYFFDQWKQIPTEK